MIVRDQTKPFSSHLADSAVDSTDDDEEEERRILAEQLRRLKEKNMLGEAVAKSRMTGEASSVDVDETDTEGGDNLEEQTQNTLSRHSFDGFDNSDEDGEPGIDSKV